MDDRSKDEKRRRVLLASVLVVLGLASGAAVRVWMKQSPDAGGAAGDSAAAFRSNMSPKAAAAWKRLLSTLATQTGRTLTVARVKNLLIDGHQEDPLAVAFANDFKRSPRLMAIWNEYADSHDTLNADSLVEKLSDSSEFAELVNKYADKPQFDLLALQVSLEAGFVIGQDALLPGSDAQVSTEAAKPGKSPAREPPLPSARGAKLHLLALEKTGPVKRYGAVAQAADQTAQPQQPGSLTGITGGPATLGGPVALGEGPVALGEAPVTDRQGPPALASKPGGHDAGKLKAIQAAGPSADATQFLSSVYENLAKENRLKLLAVCQSREVCDPVDACQTANIYAACVDACNASPKCKGKIPETPPGESEPSTDAAPAPSHEPVPSPAAVPTPTPSPVPSPSPAPAPSPTPTPACQPNTPPCCPQGTNQHPHCHGATPGSCHNHVHCTHVGHH